MKHIWMLAAAATLAACAGRGEDDMGAAPDRGDTTAVTTGADTTQWDTTGVDEQTQVDHDPGEYQGDSALVDHNVPMQTETDTTMGGETGGYGYPSDTTMGGETGGYDTPTDPGMAADTSSMGMDTTGIDDQTHVDHDPSDWQGDSALVDHNVPRTDTTEVGQ